MIHLAPLPKRSCFTHQVAVGVTVLFTLVSADRAMAALLAYEGFGYTPGSTLIGQNGGSGFANAWQPNNGTPPPATNLASSLSYADTLGNGLVTAGGSLFLQGLTTANTSSQPNRDFSFNRGTNGVDGVSTWISFLAVRQGPTTNSATVPNNPYPRAANVSFYNFQTTPSLNQEKLGIGTGSNAISNNVALVPTGTLGNIRPSGVPFNQVDFIVVRIDHISGGNDNAYLFVNPLLNSEPNISGADTNSLGLFDYSFNRIRPFAGGNNPAGSQPYAELIVDEIRVGESWADVTPFLVPEPSVAVLAGFAGLLFLFRRQRR